MGYEMVDCDLSASGRLVRVFIDKPGGVNVEDCAQVSSHLTHLFAAEGIDYERLEVSSPGLDRPLKKEADFVRFDGMEAKLKLREPIGNSRRVKGILRSPSVTWSKRLSNRSNSAGSAHRPRSR